MSKVYLTKDFSFEACHHLEGYEGDCAFMHGHSYKMQVTVSGHIIEEDLRSDIKDSMVMDFKELKRMVNSIILCNHDHRNLDTLYKFPTAEAMVVDIYHALEQCMPKDVELESVKLWETADSCAEYRGE